MSFRREGFITSVSKRRTSSKRKTSEIAPRNMSRTDSWKLVGVVGIILVLLGLYKSRSVDNNTLTGSTSVNLRGCQTVWCMSNKETFQFAIVADLDRQSKVDENKWKSYFKRGSMDRAGKDLTINWADQSELTSRLGEAGRGLELSELVAWNGKLWTFDDRSGVVFEISETENQCIPRFILMEGDGNTAKGQKTEWATVKDGKLYVGSFGKPYTNNAGEVTTRNNLWISIIDSSGMVTHEDWSPHYEFMQQVTNSVFPGYMIHEAIHWDSINRLWYVLPRRVSSDKYDEKVDETMGSNLLLAFNEDFTSVVKQLEIGEKIATHGWSSFKFVPWTDNKVIIALRTLEVEDKTTGEGSQETFLTVFNVDGEVYVPEERIPGAYKFEGIEFL